MGNKDTDYTKKDVHLVSKLADYAWETIKRKINEEEIEKNRKQYKNFIQLSREVIVIYEFKRPLPIFIPKTEQKEWVRNNLILVEYNEVFLKMSNFHNPKEVLNKNLSSVYSEETVETKISDFVEFNYFWQNREEIWFLSNSQ